MKKSVQPVKRVTRKGFLALAGEAFHVLGEDIIEGKDKVLEVTAEKFASVKKKISDLTHKNQAPAKRTVKAAVKKTVPKAVKKTLPKTVKKAVPKAVKKTVPKNTVKKSAKTR